MLSVGSFPSKPTADHGVRVEVDIEEDFLTSLTTDSEVMLYLPIAGVGGPSFIEIRPKQSKERIKPGHVQRQAAPDLLQLATNLLQDVHSLVSNTKDKLGPTLDEVEKLARRTNRIMQIFEGDIDKEDVATLSAAVKQTLGRLDNLLGSTQTTVETFGRVVAKADDGRGAISRTLNDPELYTKMTKTFDRVESLTVQVESLVSKADQASTHLPEIATNGAQALEDMLFLSKELKRLAPMLPTMIAEVDQLLFESRAMLRAAQETWLIGDVLQNEIDLGLRMPGGLRDDAADEASTIPAVPKGSTSARGALHTMKQLQAIGLAVGLLSACATTQPASETANATIAKQVALADEAYELGRYGTAASRYRQALLYARVRTTPSSSRRSSIILGHRFSRVISVKMPRSLFKRPSISISPSKTNPVH